VQTGKVQHGYANIVHGRTVEKAIESFARGPWVDLNPFARGPWVGPNPKTL